LLSAAALPFTLFSLYYQWRVVKKWCRLCLLTVAVLWVQAAVALADAGMATGDLWRAVGLYELLLAAFIFTIISAAWLLLVKPLLQNNKQLLAEKFALLRFKNNPAVFESLLTQQRRVDTTPFEHDLQLGDQSAYFQIIMVSHPQCGPCGKAHKQLYQLAEEDKIGLTIRFTISEGEIENDKSENDKLASSYFIKLLFKKDKYYKRKVLHDWYSNMNFEAFINKYPLDNLNKQSSAEITELLFLNARWTIQAAIKFTPTIFINGFQVPNNYTTLDVVRIIKHLDLKHRIYKEEKFSFFAPV
jgi:hypothetical protein